MKKINLENIKGLEEYRKERDSFRKKIHAIKAFRRIIVGPYLNFLFENRDTMLYQIQEMIYTEGITSSTGIQHEIDTYNKMISNNFELKATLLIEFENEEMRRVKLSELMGLCDKIFLIINRKYEVSCSYDKKQINEKKLSSVQFLSFKMNEEEKKAFVKTDTVEIKINHPACNYHNLLTQEQLLALQDDIK